MLLLLMFVVMATAQLMKHGCSRNLSIIRDSGFLADPLYYQERQQRHNSDNNSTASAASNTSGSGSSSSSSVHERLIQQLQQHLGAGRQVLAVTLKQDFLPLLRRTLLQLLATTRFAVRPIATDNARGGCVKALFDC